MDEISPLIALPFKLGNLITDESLFASCVDFAGIELIANTKNLFSEPSMTKLPLSLDNRTTSVPNNGIVIKIKNDDRISDCADNLCIEECLALENRLDKNRNVSHGIRKSESWVSTDEDVVSLDVPKRTFSGSLLEFSEEVKIKRLISPHNLPPLWGLTSIQGRRSEMEDSCVGLPRFLKIPPRMLSDSPLFSSVHDDLTAHLFGVYDGHGGCQEVKHSVDADVAESEWSIGCFASYSQLPDKNVEKLKVTRKLTIREVNKTEIEIEVANYCREHLHLALAEEIGIAKDNLDVEIGEHNLKEKWLRIFRKCFRRLDDEVGGFVCDDAIAPESVGSTAVVAVVSPTHIIVANCGDSRAVLNRGKVPVPLSVDHKPNREDECTRIEAAGGKVINWDGYRVSGVLAVSRSIGDRYLRPYIVADPEIMFIPRTKEDECLILASDGLWDVLTNEEACDLARKRILLWHKRNGPTLPKERGTGTDPAAQDAADYLSQLAFQRGSTDNISVIVVDLKAQRKFKKKA